MIIHIVAGGPDQFIPDLTSYTDSGDIEWIGVDRGTKWLLEAGIKPHAAVGDFDSVDSEQRDYFKQTIPQFLSFKAEKDATDMELALNYALERKPQLIRVFGATGGRLDHMLANITMLANEKILNSNIEIEIIDNQNILQIKKPGQYQIKSELKYVSFLPLSKKVENLTLVGFKYPLKDCHISFGSTLCISNELIHLYGTYSFTKGILLVVRSNDF